MLNSNVEISTTHSLGIEDEDQFHLLIRMLKEHHEVPSRSTRLHFNLFFAIQSDSVREARLLKSIFRIFPYMLLLFPPIDYPSPTPSYFIAQMEVIGKTLSLIQWNFYVRFQTRSQMLFRRSSSLYPSC